MSLRNRDRCWFFSLLALMGGILLLDAHASDFVGPPARYDLETQDPFPIRRIVASSDRIALAIGRAKDGEWHRMPREEFEKLTRAAARGGRQAAPPRLIETHYRAKLLDDRAGSHSLEGTAEWKIVNGGMHPGVMPLDSLGIAVTSARWMNNRNAVLGLIEPRSPPGLGLLVDERGEQSLALDWSSRGVVTPGELRFDLAVPISPIASMELELPSNLIPVLPQDETLVEGPYPHSDNAKRRLWRIAFGGLSHLEISLRQASDDSSQSLLLANLTSRFDLTSEAILSQFTFEYQAVRGDISTMILEYDEDLTATDVTVLNLESWRLIPDIANGTRRLEVRLREPARGGQLRITTRSSPPLNESKLWTAPTMRLVGAVNRTENLRIRVPTELKLIEWRAGAFRLVRIEQATGTSTLVFEPALVVDGTSTTARPAVRLQIAGSEYRVRQSMVWDIAAQRSALTSRADVEVQRGAVYQLLFRLPKEAEVEQVDIEPRELGSTWTVQPGAQSLLQVDFVRPLIPGSEGSATIRLRMPVVSGNSSTKAVAFPDLVPLGARQRSGEYQVRVDAALDVVAPPSSSNADLMGPAIAESGGNSSRWIYRFHGQPPVGPLSITVRPARLAASVDHSVVLEGTRLRTSVRLEAQSDTGPLKSIVLFTSEPVAESWSWRIVQGANQLVAVEPLNVGSIAAVAGAIGTRLPIDAASRLTCLTRGQWWRISFAKPLAGPVVLESHYDTASLPHPVHGESLNAPLINVLNATRLQRTVQLHIPASMHPRISQSGLIKEMERRNSFGVETSYRIAGDQASLAIDTSRQVAESLPVQIDSAHLISRVDPSAGIHCWFAFRCRGPLAQIPIQLSAGSEILSVAVAGRLLRPEQVNVDCGSSTITCTVPAPGGRQWQTIEILYKIPAFKWRLATQLVPPIPQLPVRPSLFRVEWRLPPDIAPINPANWVLLPGSSVRDRWNHSITSSPLFGVSQPAFIERADALRIVPNAKGALPKTVQQALANPGSSVEKPLIDTVAFAEASITESTPAPVGGWESLGLTLVGFQGGAVLTTPRQLSLWRDHTGSGGVASSIQNALQDAIRNGRDSSGRFHTVSDWVESLSSNESAVLITRVGGDDPGWTAWEWHGTNPLPLQVANTRDVSVLGWLVAAILAALGIVLVGRIGRTGVVLLLLWLLAAGTALRWLPEALSSLAFGPMLAGLLVALISVCRFRPRKKSETRTAVVPATKRRSSPGVIAGTTTALLFAITGTAAAPDEATVYLQAGTTDDPEPKIVFASAELIERFKQLANPKPAVCETAFLRANWTGRGEANAAEFEARISIYSFVERTKVELPIGEARLREMLLDGAAAFPKSAGAGRVTLDIEGRGEHRIDLKLTASVAGTGPDREIRFVVPEAPITSLSFQIPTGFEQPQAVNWQGAQRISADGKHLSADLGRTKVIQLRWHQAGASGRAQIRVQEAALWDLNRASSTLHAAFDYRVTLGSVQSLKIALPPSVEISRLEIRTESASGANSPSWIRDWSVGSDRVLSVDLQSALTGSFQLILEAVAAQSQSKRPGLQFPTALNVSESESYVAYRLRGLETSPEIERKGVTDFAVDSFLKDIWRPANAEQAAGPVTRAFRRIKNESAFLRPVLTHLPSAIQASQELTWQLSSSGAELRGVSRWTASNEPLTFVGWEVPTGIVIHDIRGLGLHSWMRMGNRVQVWLREPAQEVCLVWNGTMQRNGPSAETMIFDLPAVRLDDARLASTLLRVRAQEGWALNPENPLTLGVPVTTIADRELAFQVPKAAAPARFVLRGSQLDAVFQSVSVAEVVERRLRVVTFIETNLRRDRPHSVVLKLSDSTGWETTVDGPSDSSVREGSRYANVREWVIDIPARDVQRCVFSVTTNRNLASTQEIALPLISISQGDRPVPIARWFAFLGPEIRAAAGTELRRATEKPETILANRPRELSSMRERGGTWWKETSPDARPRVLAGPAPLSAVPTARLGLVDIETIRFGDRWICRASVDLIHESGARLELMLPSACLLEGVALDGAELSVPSGIGRIPIVLPFDGAPRLLQLVWTSPSQSWEPPVFAVGGKQLSHGSVLWTAIAAPGERIEVGSMESQAMHDLKRADALLRIAADPESANWPDQLRQRVYGRALRWTRLADTAIHGPRTEVYASEHGPNGTSLNDWATRMREQAQALRGPGPATTGMPVREATFDKLPFAQVFQIGTPVRWSIASQTVAPEVRVQPVSSWTPFPAIASFGLIAVAVGVLGGLMLFLARQTRPEQAAVIGLVGAAAFGPAEGLAFLGLAMLALFIRLAWTGKQIYRWLGG